jgi:GTP-binding protein
LINQKLKRIKVPQILLFNKTDLPISDENLYSYQNLRSQHCFSISALKGTNLDNLIREIVNILPSPSEQAVISNNEKGTNLLIFGAPNSGKSTLMNYLLQENRSLVTPIAGTTQEPVTSP